MIFFAEIDAKFLQVGAIRSLIMAGCFDHIDGNRNELLKNCQDIVENVQLTGQNLSLSEGLGGVPIKPAPAPTKAEKVEMEEKAMGFSTMTSPLIAVQKYAKQFDAKPLDQFQINETGVGVGKLMTLKRIRTKKKEQQWLLLALRILAVVRKLSFFQLSMKKIHNILKERSIYLLGLKIQNDRYDSSKKQYLLTNLREVHFKG